MATIYDGVRVFTAAAGNTALAADQNTFQDKMILGLSEREIALPLCSAQEDTTLGWNYIGYSGAAPAGDPWASSNYWYNSTAPSDDTVEFPICFEPEDMRITELHAWVLGLAVPAPADTNKGEIALYSRLLDTTPSNAVRVNEFGGATPWEVGAVTKYSATGLSIDITARTEYSIVFTSPQDGGHGARNNWIYGCSIKVMFHKGT
jgi:hypothetical protein